MIRFTQIPDKLKYPPAHRGKLSTLHSAVVTYVADNFERTLKYRKNVTKVMNYLTYAILAGERLPDNWSTTSPLNIEVPVDDDTMSECIGQLFLEERLIEWDVTDNSPVTITPSTEPSTIQSSKSNVTPISTVESVKPKEVLTDVPTPKEDLYIKPPTIPQFDINKVWASGVVGADKLVIYKSLPEIPTKQSEISVTTDVASMTIRDLIRLFPNHFIQTRSASMYQQVEGMTYHPDIGCVIPVAGFSDEQVLDNIIKYPHLFKLLKQVDDRLESFYSTIEIDGQLHRTLDVWDSLPESKIIPKNSEFIKEYVVRRYLLERDVNKVAHRYVLHGTLDPFLTLFAPVDSYIKLGYTDVESLAKQCVQARVSYKQSRNPILRRLSDA